MHYAVNACLFPLCAAHGLAITTVEGVGNPATGLHSVQQRLVESHGLQCGFCTPGFVMSAFALLRNNPNPTRKQVERAIEGNLCRCTGYRPILDALLTFSQDGCPMGNACCKNSSESKNKEEKNQVAEASLDGKQVSIFPPELKLHDDYFNKEVQFTDGEYTWYRPVNLQQILVLKQKHPRAPIIMGNTTTARPLAEGVFDDEKILLYGGSIPEMKDFSVTKDDLIAGGACTVSELADHLETVASQLTGEQTRHITVLLEMVSRYGSEQIRNVSTLAGSLMCGRSDSDIKTLFKVLGTNVRVASTKRSRIVPLTDLKIANNEVITAIHVPLASKNEFSAFYKQSERRSFSLAIVNAGMFAKVDTEEKIKSLRLCYGGIFKEEYLIDKVSKVTAGRSWDDALLHDVLATITDILSDDNGHKVDSYKLSVASGLWFKFFNKIQAELKLCERDEGLVRPVSLPPYSSRQVFDACTDDGQSDEDALGRTVPNVHSEAAVSGEAIYVDDLPRHQNELFVALVISSVAHAKILNVDASKALNLQGVHGYIDHRDIPGRNGFGVLVPDQELFCSGEVLAFGQPIGGIIAESREVAQRAAAMVTVEYEEMKPILTIQDAIENNSFYGKPHHLVDGDVDRGLAESEHVITGEYQTGLQEHFYLEPFAALALPKENQEMEINCTTQNLKGMQAEVAELLKIAQHKVTCKVKRLGGGFGGKEAQVMSVTGAAALAALKTKRPVRCVLPRATDMIVTGKRHPFLGKYKVGFNKNGKITALDLKLYSNSGYSLDMSGLIMDVALKSFDSGYRVKDIQVEGYLCKTNTPSNTAFRGFGHPQAVLVMEDIIFQIATTLNLNSQKVREVNLYQEGEVTPYGTKLVKCTLPELWKNCKSNSNFESRLKDIDDFNRDSKWKKRGISMTASKYGIGFGTVFMYQGAALVNIYTDGSVLVAHGGIEMGQGLNTKLIQVASSVLGIPKEKIHTVENSTREIPNAIVTAGSMGTDLYGPAVKDACETLNKRLNPLKDAMPGVPWEKLIFTAFFKRIQLSATGFYCPQKEGDFDIVKKNGSPFDYFTYGVACTEVEIDVLTGECQVLQTDLHLDIGKSLNPALDIGQIEGAFVQGLGMVTSESMEIDEKGRINNCSPLSYKIPNVKSIPRKLAVNLIKNHDIVTNIYSSKSAGEPPYILSLSVITAIKEAILAARAQIGKIGYFRLDSPATVQRIQEACGQQIKV
ncbi:xanthine dehydrogenase/oxidase-like [Mercenaria mercenaria]|uniref:xanthine dehydrogenase/oxidase-like n=1 Tax=Mercenaria mercenaria TaxID=6596 RepID=UPI00234F7B86|nr:xanthine dehydrogenase/oxidase-like [Mercenaria mercenaria]